MSSTEAPSGQILKLQAVALETGYCPQKSCCDPSPTWSQKCAGISRREKSEGGRGFHSNLLILMWVNVSHIQSHETTCSRILSLFTHIYLLYQQQYGCRRETDHFNSQNFWRPLPWSKGPLPRMTVIGCSEFLWHSMMGVQKLVVSNWWGCWKYNGGNIKAEKTLGCCLHEGNYEVWGTSMVAEGPESHSQGGSGLEISVWDTVWVSMDRDERERRWECWHLKCSAVLWRLL